MQLPALEMIDYQNQDKLPLQLQTAIEGMYKEIDNKIYLENSTLIEKSTYVRDIQNLLRNRFNMNLVFDKKLHLIFPAAVLPFFSDYLRDVNSVKNIGVDNFLKVFSFNTSIFKHIKSLEIEKKAILNKLHNKKGYIDLKNARLSGYLSEIKHYLIFDFFTLKALNIEPDELVSIILHEVGHAFHGLEVHHQLEKTNSTIVDILSEINDNKPEKALYIFKKHFTQKEFESLSVGNQKEVYDFYGQLAVTYLGSIKSQMGNAKYDETNFENLADSFSSRFNLYKPLVSGLHKLNSKVYREISRSNLMYSTLFMFDLLIHLLVLAITGPIGVVLYVYILFFVLNDSNRTMTYDFPIDRYNRVKNALINNIKDLSLPEEFVKDLLEQYVFITNIVEKTDYFKGTLVHISDFVLPGNRDNNKSIELQRVIEDNLNNILFVNAQRLRVAA